MHPRANIDLFNSVYQIPLYSLFINADNSFLVENVLFDTVLAGSSRTNDV